MRFLKWGAIHIALATIGLLGVPNLAHAAVITLFNTGVDAGGTPLPDATIGDPHYSLIIVPGGTTDIRVRRAVGGYPIPPYSGDNATSAWIGPNNASDLDGPIGSYYYRTTFDLTGLNPATASISGTWQTDNDGVNILINGASTGQTTPFNSFMVAPTAFAISSGFIAGINTIDFIINNGGGPTALRVDGISGSADPIGQPVPEPASLLLVGTGLVAVVRRWRK